MKIISKLITGIMVMLGFATVSLAQVSATATVTSRIYALDFTSTPSQTGTLTAGAQTVTVGATLNIVASQAPGVYVSSRPFQVTVNYN